MDSYVGPSFRRVSASYKPAIMAEEAWKAMSGYLLFNGHCKIRTSQHAIFSQAPDRSGSKDQGRPPEKLIGDELSGLKETSPCRAFPLTGPPRGRSADRPANDYTLRKPGIEIRDMQSSTEVHLTQALLQHCLPLGALRQHAI